MREEIREEDIMQGEGTGVTMVQEETTTGKTLDMVPDTNLNNQVDILANMNPTEIETVHSIKAFSNHPWKIKEDLPLGFLTRDHRDNTATGETSTRPVHLTGGTLTPTGTTEEMIAICSRTVTVKMATAVSAGVMLGTRGNWAPSEMTATIVGQVRMLNGMMVTTGDLTVVQGGLIQISVVQMVSRGMLRNL